MKLTKTPSNGSSRLLAFKLGRSLTHEEVLSVSGGSSPNTVSQSHGGADDGDQDYL